MPLLDCYHHDPTSTQTLLALKPKGSASATAIVVLNPTDSADLEKSLHAAVHTTDNVDLYTIAKQELLNGFYRKYRCWPGAE